MLPTSMLFYQDVFGLFFDAALLTSPGKSFCHVKHAFIAVCHLLGIHFIDSS